MGNRNQRVASSFLLVSSLLAIGALLMLGCPGSVAYYGLVAALSGMSLLSVTHQPRLQVFRRRMLRVVVRGRRAFYARVATVRLAAGGALRDPVFLARAAVVLAVGFVFFESSSVVLAEGGPWGTAAQAVCKAFTGVIGKGLALTAFVVGGLMFAFGEGGSKSALAGLIFGAGMVLSAPAFLTWVGIGGIGC